MRLRKLAQKDADRMLGWMHDSFVVEKLQTDFMSKTIEDCKSFITSSYTRENIHLAVVDDADTYMGTVSLKNITDLSAEFAITICRDAMGKGYASWAMKEIIRLGFEDYNLNGIYWCVAPDNMRALKFYDKNGYSRVESSDIGDIKGYTIGQIQHYIWYLVTK